MATDGLIDKVTLASLLKELVKTRSPVVNTTASASASSVSTVTQEPVDQQPRAPSSTSAVVQKVLDTKKVYRKPGSPQTKALRSILEGPLQRRFQLQCAMVDSVLFGKVAPRRLNKPLFNLAMKSPLREVYTKFAKDMAEVESAKVIKVCKWKIAKMVANCRGTDLQKFRLQDDGWDFQGRARSLKHSAGSKRKSAFTPVVSQSQKRSRITKPAAPQRRVVRITKPVAPPRPTVILEPAASQQRPAAR